MLEEKDLNLVIVTGGSRGLGKALIDAYELLEWSTLEFSRGGTGFNHMPVDLANLDASLPVLESQLQTLAKTPWNRVVFINNAGTLTPIAPVRALTDAQIEQNLSVNLMSGIRLMSAFVRAFSASAAATTVANISSGAAQKGYAGWPLYCAAKAGLENYIRSLAAEQQSGRPAPGGLVLLDTCPGFGYADRKRQPRSVTTDSGELNFDEYNADMQRAADILRSRSVPVELTQTVAFVGKRNGLMGYVSWGSNDQHYDAAAYHSLRFAPGAICETAVSTSARTFLPTKGGQSLIADLISQGVTGVKGYCDEPLLQAVASPSILLDRYSKGWTLAESFYAASRFVGWEDIVIGDPLCRPYPATRE